MEEIKQVKCNNCGKTYYNDDRYCPFCGTKSAFFNETSSEQNNNQQYNNYQNNNYQNNRTDNKISEDMIILIILLIVFWPAALIYYLVKMKK